ncbi:MAG: IS1 family transposase, partial [Anaerolineales bacterium]|nr:IS1 family transposase [Anaerolineales bacterium]
MTQLPLNPQLANCPNCGEREKIWIHSQKERRFKCVSCGRTFAETSGTIFYQLQYPMWLVVVVVTLLAYGCP